MRQTVTGKIAGDDAAPISEAILERVGTRMAKERHRQTQWAEIQNDPAKLAQASHEIVWDATIRALDWRYKWDNIYPESDKRESLKLGGSRWTSGKFFTPGRTHAAGHFPGADEFYLQNQSALTDKGNVRHLYLLKTYVVGCICDSIEAQVGPNTVAMSEFKRSVAYPDKTMLRRFRVYDDALKAQLTRWDVPITYVVKGDLEMRRLSPEKWLTASEAVARGNMNAEEKAVVLELADNLVASDEKGSKRKSSVTAPPGNFSAPSQAGAASSSAAVPDPFASLWLDEVANRSASNREDSSQWRRPSGAHKKARTDFSSTPARKVAPTPYENRGHWSHGSRSRGRSTGRSATTDYRLSDPNYSSWEHSESANSAFAWGDDRDFRLARRAREPSTDHSWPKPRSHFPANPTWYSDSAGSSKDPPRGYHKW